MGYRVKSKTATQFRIWATERLRGYLVKGAAINERRLEQIGQVVQILDGSTDELVAGVADDALFGGKSGDGLESVVYAIQQTFGGEDLYPTTEEKAANLLYLVVKGHPLSDGDKRSAAAITLLVAMSDPKGGPLSPPGTTQVRPVAAISAECSLLASEWCVPRWCWSNEPDFGLG